MDVSYRPEALLALIWLFRGDEVKAAGFLEEMLPEELAQLKEFATRLAELAEIQYSSIAR